MWTEILVRVLTGVVATGMPLETLSQPATPAATSRPAAPGADPRKTLGFLPAEP